MVKGLKLSDLGLSGEKSGGISFDDLAGVQSLKEIKYQNYLDCEKDWFQIEDCYVIDTETYRLNSRLRCIQILDVKKKVVHFLVHGWVEDFVQQQVIQEIGEKGFKVEFQELESEERLLEEFCSLLTKDPKGLIGHNLAHFDLGIIHSKIKTNGKYKLVKKYPIKFKGYTVGSGRGQRKLYFSYIKGKDDKEGERFNIVDTLSIAWTLFLPSALKKISRASENVDLVNSILNDYGVFPKKEIDYKVFEKEKLPYEAVIYSIYDVLSIPRVYLYLRSIIEDPTKKYLKIGQRASLKLCDHVWMKGSGALAEAYLTHLLGRVNPNTPDFLTKYFGGICRTWKLGLFSPGEGEVGRQLDFTSEYPFGIVYQRIFDILNGNFHYLHDKRIRYSSTRNSTYDRLIYSTTFELKCKRNCNVLIEVDKSKNNDMVGFGFIRSFNEQKRVQDLEHSFSMNVCVKGQTTIVTKTELEMNLTINPQFWRFFEYESLRVIDGLIATSNKKTLEYIDLFRVRQKWKYPENPDDYSRAEIAIKYIINACYGKLAQSTGEWFNLALASATTGFGRVQLFKACIFSLKVGLRLIYSDTDSLYVFGKEHQIQKLVKYGNVLNPYPQKMFQIDNLKVEKEDILALQVFKRKRYTKIFNDEDGKLQVEIKGENGNSDYRWRDILFRLSLITNGSLQLDKIQKHIQKREFGYRIPNNNDVVKLEEEKKLLKKEIRVIKKQIREHIKEKKDEIAYSEFSDNLDELLDEEGFVDEVSGKMMKIGEFIKSTKSGLEDVFEIKMDRIMEIEDQIKNDFITLYRRVYEKHQGKKLNVLIPELKSEAKITMMYDVHFKKSIEYEDGIYYKKIRYAWESETKETAYIGCFFSINRDIKEHEKDGITSYFGTFEPKSSKDFLYQINPKSYVTQYDTIPVIENKFYMELLNRQINIDTIVLKTRNPIGLWNLDEDSKKAVTFNSFYFPHNGKRRHHSLKFPALLLRFRLKGWHTKLPGIKKYITRRKANWDEDKEHYEKAIPYIEFLKGEKNTYANCTMFIQNVVRLEAVVRVNKFRLFCPNPNIFNVYRTMDKLARTFQLTIERMYELRKVKIAIPRLTFLSQLDISQETTEELAFQMWINCWKKSFTKKSVGEFLQCDFVSYMSLTVYHKERSANNKLHWDKKNDYQTFSNEERKYFEWESLEAWRSEIKFKLQRNYAESLSYAYILSIIKQEHFLEFIKEFQSIRKQKVCYFRLKSHFQGKFHINHRKCLILFHPFTVVPSLEIFGGQLTKWYKIYFKNRGTTLLMGVGSLNPPHLGEQGREKKSVKIWWEREFKKEELGRRDFFLVKDSGREREIFDKMKKREKYEEYNVVWEFKQEDLQIDPDVIRDSESLRREKYDKTTAYIFNEVFSRY